MPLRLAVALFVAGCQMLPTTGVSRDRAIKIALSTGSALEQPVATGAREGRLRDLRVGRPGELGPDVDLNELVWQVTLQGKTSICQPVPGGACTIVQATTQVYLDHATGAFIFSETSANPGPIFPAAT